MSLQFCHAVINIHCLILLKRAKNPGLKKSFKEKQAKNFNMSRLPLSHLSIVLALVFLTGACAAVGGEVVKVSVVQEGRWDGLKEEERAKLEEIRKAKAGQEIDASLGYVIEETPHFSVSEYLAKYPDASGRDGKDYKVGGYDVLSLVIYEEEDLSREAVRVSADGYISFPFVGRLKADNLTTSEIENLISRKLAEGQYLLDAHVSVMVVEFNSQRFLVLGAVQHPGSYALKAQERVLDAISRAGGIRRATDTYRDGQTGAGKKGMIIRTENPNTPQEQKIVINLDLQGLLKGRDQISNIFLTDKDVVFIPTAEKFFIIGEVERPGSYTLTDMEITLVEAISMAGGFTPIAARNRTRIIRVEAGVEKIIEVKVDAITDAGKKIQDVIIQPNDVIVVPESFF
ncbi:MAG: polysaccharide biosynthesis/export family protein [Deltaproteobacteria bacterium]|nr:polysaccharide biosynthesis/export family protein [Deltaproteobacteria bacterium]